MANIREIKKRITSVKNTAKITKAMEMVAASKMRKAQDRAIQSRPYEEKLMQVLGDLAAQPKVGDWVHPLLLARPVKKIAIIEMTSNKGLCGGLNANVNKLVGNFILSQSLPVQLVTVGKKGRDFMSRAGREIRAEFVTISDRPYLDEALPVARIAIDDYINGVVDQVFLAYPKFRSTAIQQPVMEQLLPIEPASIPESKNVEYIYEPSPKEVLMSLLPRYVEMEIYHALLETIASEHSSRMVAMRNATDAAEEMVDSLTLKYNKARQEQITTELLDITAGAVAVSK
ncbi:MAG: ATP synthase F1 subunit gamma [Dehalococcoidia bacterium]|nr:ATP synthase F1 subunit gamma [Dehalococcoidia bacterium]